MPQASRSPVLLAAARWWARRELRVRLDGLQAAGLADARAAAGAGPVIFIATHVAWWDAFVLLVLDDALGTDGFALMDAENACRVPVFARLGAIPVERGRARAGLRSAASLLDRPGRAVWIFPQGQHRPPHLRPLGFRPGVRLLARLAPASTLIPTALQYAFAQSQGPVAYAAFGSPLEAASLDAPGGMDGLERAVERCLERIDRRLAGGAEDFESLVPTRAWPRRTNSRIQARGPARR